jgi:hypothetical protein
MKNLNKFALAILLGCTLIPARTQTASASVDCGTLKGVGAIALIIDAVRYTVLIQCPAPAQTSI